MADVAPFPALRYDDGVAGPLGALVAPPYDVISEAQRQELLGVSPHNAVRLILPEVPYDEVAAILSGWRTQGVLRQDTEPSLIAWTQTFALADGVMRERRTLLGAVALEPYSARVVRPHERTHAGPREDRLRLTRAVRANLSPVFGLYPDPQGLAWSAAGVGGEPEAELTDPDGVVHRIWRVTDPARCAAVAEALRERWILIADGHHRYETALAYRDERRAGEEAARSADPAPYDRVLMGLTALDDEGLVVLPTHRVLARWPEGAGAGFDATPVADLPGLLQALAEAPAGRPVLGLVRPEGAALLTGPAPADPDPSRRLDVAVLEERVLLPHLGADQAALSEAGELTYTKDAGEAWALVRDGAAAAALILRPIAKADVQAVAEAGGVMPQKSTYFFPKLLTGVAFRSLVDG